MDQNLEAKIQASLKKHQYRKQEGFYAPPDELYYFKLKLGPRNNNISFFNVEKVFKLEIQLNEKTTNGIKKEIYEWIQTEDEFLRKDVLKSLNQGNIFKPKYHKSRLNIEEACSLSEESVIIIPDGFYTKYQDEKAPSFNVYPFKELDFSRFNYEVLDVDSNEHANSLITKNHFNLK